MARGLSASLFALFLLCPAVTHAAATPSPEQFYSGKTINLLIGFAPGGDNDSWARTIARYWANHIPGRPRLVPQNVPGAGSLRLMNQIYNTYPKDGTYVGLISRGIPFEPLLGGQGTQFDASRVNWLGSPDRDTNICVARRDSAVKAMGDLFTKELLVGATGSGADTAIYPEFLASLLGMKFKLVNGYQGTNEISLALERKEVEGVCVAHDSIMRDTIGRSGQLNILFQATLVADPRLPNVPLATDLARSENDRQALELFFARVAIGRPFAAPPGVPADRVAALRRAFDDTMKDPAFLADTRRQGFNVDAIKGEEIADRIAAAYRTPRDVVARTISALGRPVPGNLSK
jgi:tripartite-type tricarboxylate transporter receptor subunit TctC